MEGNGADPEPGRPYGAPRGVRGGRPAPDADQGLGADEHPGRPRRGRSLSGRLLPLLRLQAGTARGGHREDGRRRPRRGGASGRGHVASCAGEAAARLQRHRSLEDRAEAPGARAARGLAVRPQRDGPREVPAADGRPSRGDATSDHRPGNAGGRLQRGDGARDRAGSGDAAPRLAGRRHRPFPRPAGRTHRAHGCRAKPVRLFGSIRADPRRSRGIHWPHRPVGSCRVVRVRRARMAAIIEVDRLSKSYGGKRGIVDVSFQVAEGEVFGFLGPNGAGKTTTIRILMALIRADSGTARIAGLDCWKQSVEIKRLVGYVPGEPSLDGNLTGGQILEYFAHLRGGDDQKYLKQLEERLDLDTGRKFRQYSTGNKRKVVLIQAFMHKPRVLILDEPTSGLDPLNQQEFDGMVREARDDGRTVFLASHVLSEVEKTCNRVGIIRDGSIVRIGDVAEVKAIKRYEITITFASAVPAETFKTLEGVAEVETLDHGHAVRLAMQGSADAVIKAAARFPVVSLTSYEPSLEDIFLRYYEAEGVPAKEAQGVV